jgi:hypothetical protein
VAEPFLDADDIGPVPLHHVLAVLEGHLRLCDLLYPGKVAAGELTHAEAALLYRGWVAARRVVLQAMQLALPLKG